MKEKQTKIWAKAASVCFALIFSLSLAISAAPMALAVDGEDPFGQSYGEEIGLSGEKDPQAIVAGLIKVAMGFLGIVAVSIILLGGFKWMTASGNEEEIKKAQGLIKAGIIGLIIILAAWSLTTWLIKTAMTVTGA